MKKLTAVFQSAILAFFMVLWYNTHGLSCLLLSIGAGMKAVVQRVVQASVSTGGAIVGSIGRGIVVLLGVKQGDGLADADWLADKVANLRIFSDDQDKMNLSLLDVSGEALIVSQFTLYGDCSRGRRPSYTEAAEPGVANELYEYFVAKIREQGVEVATGVFQARCRSR